MIAETVDAQIINGFANHPEIAPFIGGGELDLSPGIGGLNVFLFGEHGGFCFIWSAPETYEVHVMLTKAGKGRWGIAAGRLAIRLMAKRGMTHLWGRIHPERPEVGTYGNLCGMHDTGTVHLADIGTGPVGWRIFNWRAECHL